MFSTTYTAPAGIYDSLVQNTDGTWSLKKKDQTVYHFNASGFCDTITDRNGNQISLTLNSANYVTQITDSTGKHITVNLDSSNKFQSITTPDGRTWSFTINGSGDLSTVTWPSLGDGNTYTDSYTYNSSHGISTYTNKRGKTSSYAYNSSDASLASETDPLSHTTSYSYSSSSTTITDPLSHTRTDNYSSGILASIVDPSGFSQSFTSRDTNHNVLTQVDARGKTWTYTYDSMGNVLTSTDPLSHT